MRSIHMIWYQGEENIPRPFLSNIDALRSSNPGWTVYVWDAYELERLASKYGVHSMYTSFKHMHQKIDLGRYLLLYEYGGLSMDMDVRVVRPLSFLPGNIWDTENRLVVSSLNLDALEKAVYGPVCGTVNNAIIYARNPSHPLLWKLIKSIRPGNNIWFTTGPCVFSRVVESSPDALVLPPYYFEPVTISVPHRVDRPDLSIVVHEHSMTWLPPYARCILSFYSLIKPLLILFAIVIVLALIAAIIRGTRRIFNRS